MALSSYNFVLLFLPIVMIGFYFFRKLKVHNLQLLWLLIASFFFYTCNVPVYILLLFFDITVNYFFYRLIYKKPCKFFLNLSILFNTLLLFYFKYINFGIDISNLLFHTNFAVKNIALPLGISFITFQQIAFMVETFKGTHKEECNLLEYSLFVSFFPHISSGPIIGHEEFIPLLKKDSSINWDKLASGIYLFLIGFGKKVLIADFLAKGVDYGYSNLATLNTTTGLFISLLYTLQIYYDFSGYSDMAIGIARMLQLDLPVNFNSPYKATTITEFWNRWHITLTRFLTRYIYIPLGGNRKGKLRSYINTLIVFLVSGLWHGASYTFIFWGLLHGIFMVFTKHFNRFIQRIPKWINHTITLLFVNFTWIIFRAGSVQTLKEFVNVFLRNDWGSLNTNVVDILLPSFISRILPENYSNIIVVFILLIIIIIVTLFAPNTQETLTKKDLNLKNLALVLFIGILSIFSMSGINTFIYAYF